MAEEPAAIAPSLKITGLHVAGFRSLRRLDWPKDGLGWNGQVPDIVLVGGANGSGKTTLLEGLFSKFDGREFFSGAKEARLDLHVTSEIFDEPKLLRLAVGGQEFLDVQGELDAGWLRDEDSNVRVKKSPAWETFKEAAFNSERFWATDLPRVIYVPSNRRLTFPEQGKYTGTQRNETGAIGLRYRDAKRYEESLVGLLYDARWQDLNAKEEGRLDEADNFENYVDAFHRFVGEGKQLAWHRADLYVRMADGTLHDLPELSSGEKQILIFAAELRSSWVPGSIVLIDEPELHLHEAWQTTLFELIRDLQRERGGQVILATQSSHLFNLGEPGTKVVLRKDWP